MKKNNYISFLKGIASILIIIVHSPQSIEGIHTYIIQLTRLGRWGCQLFFLISGFLYAKSWNRDNDIKNFYKKRFVSLIPMYWFALAFWVVIYFSFSSQASFYPFIINARGIVLNIFLLHGFSKTYINSVVPGGWYIGTFVIMVALFPIIMRGYTLCNNRIKGKIPYIFAGFSILVQLLVCILWRDFSVCKFSSFMNLSILNQLTCFLLGISLFYNFEEYSNKKYRSLFIRMTIYGSAAVFIFYLSSVFVPATIITTLIFGEFFKFFFICVSKKIKNLQVSKYYMWICELGDMSYEIYYVNFFVTMFLPWYILKNINMNYNGTIIYVISIPLMVLLTYLMARYIYRIKKIIVESGRR